MRILIIYKSIHHQNTKKIAEVLAKELKADLKEAGELKDYNLGNYDLVGFGSGIYFWQHHHQLLDLVEKLKFLKNQKVFIFSTSGAPFGGSFHQKLRQKLVKKGCKVIGEFNCLGWDSFGILKFIGGINKKHPNQKDFQKARQFAKNLLLKS